MTLRAKVRGQMRTVSPAMARRLRAKGVAVVDMCPPEPTALLAPHQVAFVVGAPANMTPEQPVPNMADLVIEMPGVVSAAVAAKLEERESAFDLSDEELEKLTAPES